MIAGRKKPVGDREKGHITWFSHLMGYGFISRTNGMPDAFVHFNEFRHPADARWVSDGDAVEFAVEHAAKGPRAQDVVVI
jgi:CspA family cold shock protein